MTVITDEGFPADEATQVVPAVTPPAGLAEIRANEVWPGSATTRCSTASR